MLESDEVVDQYRDRIFEALLSCTTEHPGQAAPNLHFVLASRHLERIADHATNIAEDILFWVRGLEVRHGRGRQLDAVAAEAKTERRRLVIEFSHNAHRKFKRRAYRAYP